MLDELTDEFDALLAGMQTAAPKVGARPPRSTPHPTELGRAAVKAARASRR